MMDSDCDLVVRKAPLPWWAAGILLGLIQVGAVGLNKPLGVSTEFVVADAIAVHHAAPEYAESHPLIKDPKYQTLGPGAWLDVGIVCGAFLAALFTRRWRIKTMPVWWRQNRGPSAGKRFFVCFIGGFLILLGARFAHGCTSGAFASAWAQLSLSAVPFTLTLFGFGMLAARLMYPKTPEIDA